MNNSASRISALLDQLNNGKAQLSARDQWIRVLNLDLKSVSLDEDAVEGMQVALSEIRQIERSIKSLGAPDHLFEQTAVQLRRAFSPGSSNSAWRDIGSTVQERAVKNSLEWASWVLREFDQPDIDSSTLEKLLESIDAQELLLSAEGLSVPIKEMLQRQLRQMRVALRLYDIQGAQPLRDAVNGAIGELATTPQHVFEAASNSAPDNAALRGGVELITEVGKAADAGSKIVKFGEDMVRILGTAWPLIESTIKGLS